MMREPAPAALEVAGPRQVVHYRPDPWAVTAVTGYQESYRRAQNRNMRSAGEQETFQENEQGIPVFKRQYMAHGHPLHCIPPFNTEEIIDNDQGTEKALENKGKDKDTDVQNNKIQWILLENYYDFIKKLNENNDNSKLQGKNKLIEKYMPEEIERYINAKFEQDNKKKNVLIEKYIPGEIERYIIANFYKNDKNVPFEKRGVADPDIDYNNQGIDKALENKDEDENIYVQQDKLNQWIIFLNKYYDFIEKLNKNGPLKQGYEDNLIEKYVPGEIERYIYAKFYDKNQNRPFEKREFADPFVSDYVKNVEGTIVNKGEAEEITMQQVKNEWMVILKKYNDFIKKLNKNNNSLKTGGDNNLNRKYIPGEIERYINAWFYQNNKNNLGIRGVADSDLSDLIFDNPKINRQNNQRDISSSDKKIFIKNGIFHRDEPSVKFQDSNARQNEVSNCTICLDAGTPRSIRDDEHVPQQEPKETNKNMDQVMTSSEGKKLYHVKGRQKDKDLQVYEGFNVISLLPFFKPKPDIKDKQNLNIRQDQIQRNENPQHEKIAHYVGKKKQGGEGILEKKIIDGENKVDPNSYGLNLRTSNERLNADGSNRKVPKVRGKPMWNVGPDKPGTSDQLRSSRKTYDDMMKHMTYGKLYRRKAAYNSTIIN